MADDDSDRQEVDRLVRELSAPKPPVPPKPGISQASSQPPPEQHVPRVSRWTNVRILMPAMRAAHPRRTFSSALGLPDLPALAIPDLSAFWLTSPGETTARVLIVRTWVTLGLLLSLSMPYWPYPKTYLLGLLLYIFAVALVAVAGVWAAKLTWEVRLGAAHTISLGIVLWAIVLVAADTLPLVSGGS